MNTTHPEQANRSASEEGSRPQVRLDEMRSILKARVKSQPENAEVWRELAQTKMMLGDIAGAENDCIECLRLEPTLGLSVIPNRDYAGVAHMIRRKQP